MNDQLERELAESFDRRAAAPVDPSMLAITAARRGRQLRTRVYAVRVLGGAVALAVLSAAGALGAGVLRADGDGQRVGVAPSPSPSATSGDFLDRPPPGGWKAPALPVARGLPGAAQAPQQVGTDPAVLHFTVDGWTTDAALTTWTSRAGSETVDLRKGDVEYEVTLARTVAPLDALRDWHTSGNGDTYVPGEDLNSQPLPAPDKQRAATVNGKPATLYSWSSPDAGGASYLRWQPADGLWAQVYSMSPKSTEQDAAGVAAAVRLDTAYRCASRVRLAYVPSGAKLRLCQVVLTGADWIDDKGDPSRMLSALLLVGSGKNVLRVEAGPMRNLIADPDHPTSPIGGHQARPFTNQLNRPAIQVFDVNGVDVLVSATGSYNLEALKAVVTAVTVSGDGRDPATWPTPIVG